MPPPDPDEQALPITVLLPDRQEIDGRLVERRQIEGGAWRYLVALVLWCHTESGAVEAAEYRVYLTPEEVRPIPGVSYDGALTHRLPPAPVPVPAGPRWGWRVERRLDGQRRPQGTVVHVHDCELAAGAGREVDLDEALTALRRHGSTPCKTCDAAASLMPLL
ncbi:DUF6233 domain-containing protein (plasmid) [Streptomyces sp. NBC_01023]|uniref:DUF6233 domain-containing protein n=1 Tax=unclassified Streptomyces TaxID=2593676 RepID=UPI002F90F97B|nr:DUF6233 domain-containing protein [Streptomyces sp. NBC_01023]